MDAEMEERDGMGFDCGDVDLDYEFDAVKFFDFGAGESPEEAAEAERWFEASGSYPPSPLVAKIFAGKDAQMESVNNIEAPMEDHVPEASAITDGWKLQNLGQQDIKNAEQRSTHKKHFKKSSTLMKPTASHLAKQNQSRQMKAAYRIQKHLEIEMGRSCVSSNEFIHQVIKRQKLEQGHYSKVLGVNEHIDFFHKAPDKRNLFSDLNTQFPRTKITIPREPELQTARRAVGIRARQSRKDNVNNLSEGSAPKTAFKALPLNRKILEAPTLPLPQRSKPQMPKFKEFSFMTHERALQHTSSSSSTKTTMIADSVKGDAKLYSRVQHHSSCQHLQNDAKSAEGVQEDGQKFRAQVVNRKVLLSKGEIGLSQSAKQEPTVPKVNLTTPRRCQPAPLSELFNKLSLTIEAQMTASDPATDPKFQLPSHLNSKDKKENIIGSRKQ